MDEDNNEHNGVQQKEDDNFRNLAEGSSVAFLVIRDQMIIYANRAAGMLFKTSDMHLLVNHNILDFIAPVRNGSESPGEAFSVLCKKATETGEANDERIGIKIDKTQFFCQYKPESGNLE